MPGHGKRQDIQLRQRLSQEAARIMIDEGVKEFGPAKRKAAQRLGISSKSHLPSNQDIERAITEYQRIFRAEQGGAQLRQLREEALRAMSFLQAYQPRLVGRVLAGTAGEYTDVSLHLFADTAEDVGLFLMERRIPFESATRRLRMSAGVVEEMPVYRFRAGETGIDLIVFPLSGLRQAPLSPVDGRPMARADAGRVQDLLDDDAGLAVGQ